MEFPTGEIIQRVFVISPNKRSCGSSLAYPVNGFFHFITAAHVLVDMQHGVKSNLHIFKDGDWLKVDAIPFFGSKRNYQNGDLDIAIVRTSMAVTGDEPEITLGSDGLIFGQDVYFLGFPYFQGNIVYKPNSFNFEYPIPFIKKATASALHYPIIYLDGHNNFGFSGGPVMFWDHKERKRKICGVISAYMTHEGEIKRIETATKEFYQENSGIAVAYSIKPIIDLIEELKN